MSKLSGEYVTEVKFLLNFQVTSLKKTAFFQFDPYLSFNFWQIWTLFTGITSLFW